MEPEKVKELIEMMKANDLSELEIVDGQTRIVLKRGPTQLPTPVVAMTPALPTISSLTIPTESAGAAAPGAARKYAVPEEEKLSQIVSPIVGTIFAAPSPNANPFVEVGSKVNEDTIVCIIEAMKVMNEIKSGISGTIKKILVASGSSVEYGQPLFLVAPD